MTVAKFTVGEKVKVNNTVGKVQLVTKNCVGGFEYAVTGMYIFPESVFAEAEVQKVKEGK